MKKIKRLFWNQKQKRLRTIWRLVLHASLVFVLTGVLMIAFLFMTVIGDAIFGTDLIGVVDRNDPMGMLSNPWLGSVLIPIATLTGIFLATVISGRWLDRRKFQDFGLRFSKVWWREFGFGLFLGAFLMGFIFLFGWLIGNVQVVGFLKSFSERGSFLTGFLQSLVFYLFVGFYEELFSRGYHLVNLAEGFNDRIIGKRWAVILALAISSIVFGLLHMNNPNATWVSTLNISFAGIFLGLGMVLTGRLAIPIGLHITWNFFQGNVFGFAVSGTMRGVTLIATESVGPVWLTGGKFGPEAGVMGLMAMVIGSVLIILWVKRGGNVKLRDDLAVYEPLDKGLQAD
jgi:uncharacterized protein